jgi:hypothetical protein
MLGQFLDSVFQSQHPARLQGRPVETPALTLLRESERSMQIRNLMIASSVALAALLLSACSGSDAVPPTTPRDDAASRPAQVLLAPSSDTLGWVTATRQFSASVLNNAGLPLSTPVTWTSSAAQVATISTSGLVTAVGPGTTSIVATAGTISGTAILVVRQVPARWTKLSGDNQSQPIRSRLSAPLVVEVKDEGGMATPGVGLTWSVTVGGGALESASTETDASGRGQAIWRLGSTVGGHTVQVVAGALSPLTFSAVGERLIAANITLLPAADTLDSLGDTVRVRAEAKAADGSVIDDALFTFSSTQPSVATVSSSGLVTAMRVGSTEIIAAADAQADTAVIVVRQVPSSVVVISGNEQTGSAGAPLPASLLIEVRDARSRAIPGVPVTWSVVDGGGSLAPSASSTSMVGRADASWRLGSALGTQVARASAGPISVDFTAQATPPVVDRITLVPAAATLIAIEDTVRFVATARDAMGSLMGGVAIALSIADTTVASMTSEGLATARSAGNTIVIASAGTKADTATLRVIGSAPQPDVVITNVNPAVLLEGASATITGSGFAPTPTDNRVTLDGVAVAVTAATATGLTITVPRATCQPPREATLTVAVGAKEATRSVDVTPRRMEDLELERYWTRYTFSGNGCLHLPGSTTGAEYLIGVVSTSQNPSPLTPISLSAVVGDATIALVERYLEAPPRNEATEALSGSPVTPARGPLMVHPEHEGRTVPMGSDRLWNDHAEIMRRNEELAQLLGPGQPELLPQTVQAMSVSAGDTLTLFADYNRTCSTSKTVRAVVRLVGTSAIWLEDIANPSGTFTTQELAQLDAFYTAHTRPMHEDYFGAVSDIDRNGRTLVLMTQEVNKVNLGGWVWWGDLYPRSQCATSNQGEIMFVSVPDPSGAVGPAYTRQSVLDYYPMLVTHEVTHIVQGNHRIFGTAGAKAEWEVEGAATLSEQLVAYRLFGHASGQNLGYEEYLQGSYWYWNAWLADMQLFFGWDLSGDRSGKVARAPEQCTWVGRNAGPCGGSAVYGAPSMIFRSVLDGWGPDFPGGERALMKRLAQSPQRGFASLTEATGAPIELILARFYTALWADGRILNSRGMTSWDLYDIFRRFPANRQLEAYTTSASSPSITGSVTAGSNLYLHWTPSGAMAPTSLRVTTPSGGSTPSEIFVWVLRVR